MAFSICIASVYLSFGIGLGSSKNRDIRRSREAVRKNVSGQQT